MPPLEDSSEPADAGEIPALPRGRRAGIWLLGMVAANGTMAALIKGMEWLSQGAGLRELGRVMGLPSFFLLPTLGGVVAAYCWRSLRPSQGAVAWNTLLLTLMTLGGAYLAFGEGSVCLIIASPLLYACALAGASVGRLWFQNRDRSRLKLSLVPLLMALVVGEPLLRGGDREGVVSDEILIHATPAQVWPMITSFPAIVEPPRFWLFRLGLPYPMATTSAGDYVGADRRCIFSGGAEFIEQVAECEPGQRLTFDIVQSPPDPELLGHLTPERGQFLLRDNGDGTTTLTGHSWYKLHVRPLMYFDWWTHHILRAVHVRVMEDVRRRAQASR